MQIVDGALVVNTNGLNVTKLLPPVTRNAKVKVWSVPTDYREDGVFLSVTEAGEDEEVPACNHIDTIYLGELTLEAGDGAKLAALKSAKLAEINNAFNAAMADLAKDYPEYEIKSWPQQVKEAEAYNANPQTDVPLLASIANQRSITVAELANRVLANASTYSVSAGVLIGRRQAAEDRIELAATPEAIAEVVW